MTRTQFTSADVFKRPAWWRQLPFLLETTMTTIADVVHTVAASGKEKQHSDHQQDGHHEPNGQANGHAKGDSDDEGRDEVRLEPTLPPTSSHLKPPINLERRPQRSRSNSYTYTPTFSAARPSRTFVDENSDFEGDAKPEDAPPEFGRRSSTFRGALEYNNPEQREKERVLAEKREKQRAGRESEDTWNINPLKWLGVEPTNVSPSEEEQGPDEGGGYFDLFRGDKGKGKAKDQDGEDGQAARQQNGTPVPNGSSSKVPQVARRQSMPSMTRKGSHRSITARTPGWGRLRSRLPELLRRSREQAPTGQSVVAPHVVNITDELISGGLSTMMIKLWMERDEYDNRRVPVLLHRLRVRISDSLYPTKEKKAVFRIECEYANGTTRWVVYRQLHDFYALHGRYKLSNVYFHNVDAMPQFPKTSEGLYVVAVIVAYFFCQTCHPGISYGRREATLTERISRQCNASLSKTTLLALYVQW